MFFNRKTSAPICITNYPNFAIHTSFQQRRPSLQRSHFCANLHHQRPNIYYFYIISTMKAIFSTVTLFLYFGSNHAWYFQTLHHVDNDGGVFDDHILVLIWMVPWNSQNLYHFNNDGRVFNGCIPNARVVHYFVSSHTVFSSITSAISSYMSGSFTRSHESIFPRSLHDRNTTFDMCLMT